ncbi:hypothetical protein ACHWQZ_G002397 [Mnemiopsis leidyi]
MDGDVSWSIWKILTLTFGAIIVILIGLLSYALYTILKLRLYQIAIKNINCQPNSNFSNVVANHSNVEKIEENGIIYKDYTC